MSRPTKLLTIAEAAEMFGTTQRKLRSQLLTRERQTGRSILVRIGEGENRPTYRVSLDALRRTMPELFDRRDEVQKAARELLRPILARLDSIDERLDEVTRRQAVVVNAIDRKRRA